MNAYCPECETELDVTTGICPACRWDPLTARAMTAEEKKPDPEMSLTERYRGTNYDVSMHQATMDEERGFSRGRAFVLVSLVGAVALYGGVMSTMGIF